MKNIGVVTALLLAATLSSGVMAAENSFARPEAGSNIDTSAHQNHIDVSHAFDKESLTAGNLQ
ncbi:hypothetical protein AB9C65_13335 [Klebsiella pasteurii]|uniref:Uncharacterized protein n=1 Tax=Klebsiella pasteurii TaxID=2587529 RepID=A0ABD5HG70_9ENTR|nr:MULTISPECIES: hypothetical protein [Klebsiella]MBG2718626.1 hypothetical protein [Klebsiella michiganensis]AYZ20542.1 hypothetical protein EGY08_29610 [Klebsiella sp. FDAARGOS_511]MDC0693250.1 hypothetical protein [Klebsiella pasteurii]MDC0754809.1 hypothetical protein [Klebsiella pasteurii]MDD9650685.1 hypothetical protein [Klebsiella pasteurii]